MITYSEDFSQWSLLSAGTGTNPIVTSNNAISPDGTQNATKIVFDKGASSSDSDYSLIRFDNGIADIDGTASIYLRSDVNVDIELSPDFNNYTTLNVTTEWQRFTVSDSTSDRLNMGLRGTYPSNNTATVYAWGAQLEQSSYPTSYIPTQGSSVTRVAETCNGAGDVNTFNDSEGVLFVEGSLLSESINDSRISISDGASAENRITLRYLGDNDLGVQIGFTGGFDETVSLSAGNNKVAVVYNSTTASVFVNGVKVVTNTMSSLSGLSQLQFARFSSGTLPFYGKTKDVRVYNTALTDAELQALTTI